MNQMRIELVLSDKEYELLSQWYQTSDNYKRGERESMDLIVKLDQAFMKEQAWHEKNKEHDGHVYNMLRYSRKMNW